MTESPDTASPDEASSSNEARVERRAELLPEEQAAGSDDSTAQAEAILAESDERTDDPEKTRHDYAQTPDYKGDLDRG